MNLLTLFLIPLLLAQTIAEKKANLNKGKSDLPYELDQNLDQINQIKGAKEDEIRILYQKGWELYENGAPRDAYELILNDIRRLKRDLNDIEAGWQKKASKVLDPEPYGLFHQPETTIEQLVIDYGSQDFVYLIPKEVGSLPISLSSHLPVPRSGWNEMIELILNQSGVVVTPLNPYLKKLSLAKEDFSHIRRIVTEREMLSFVPRDDRILFLLSPDPLEMRRAELFLDKFSNKATQQVVPLGRQIALVSTRGEVEELLRLYDFLQKESGGKEFSLVSLHKVSGEEMAKMLAVLFDEAGEANKEDFSTINSLRIMVSKGNPRSLFLVGSKDEVRRAEEIVRKVEGQMGDYKEKSLYWYTPKHADPNELADVLFRVYNLLVSRPPSSDCCDGGPNNNTDVNVVVNEPPPELLPAQIYSDSFYQAGDVVVNPAPVELGSGRTKVPNQNRPNFIVDQKSGAIVMVIEADLLSKIKDTIHRLDIPNKMVQIEVLLFEKRTNDRNQFGLNKFKIGDPDITKNITSLAWCSFPKGILDFFMSRPATSNAPSFELLYTFLISQDDIQINASPSALTLNQTKVKLSVVDEISLNTGIFEVPQSGGGVALKDSFTRAQYGINLEITPTIHLGEEGMDEDTITLETIVGFDTIHPGEERNRPEVTRRKMESQAVVADGESVILGGLRRKINSSKAEKIPFFGEIPCLGKFFSFTSQEERTTEMFIIITPKIVRDPLSELEWIKNEEMCRRPGDLPDYLCRLDAARRSERNRLFSGTLQMIAGPRPARCHSPGWQRDGFEPCP